MPKKKQILFVDDEERILSGFRRMLRSKRSIWDMHFAPSGKIGIEMLKTQKIDVLITDMRMPQFDGLAVLKAALEQSPKTIRIVLSGHADKEASLKATKLAHQFLSKPCSADEITKKINALLQLNDSIKNPNISKMITKIGGVPSLPDIYNQVMREMEKEYPSLKKIGDMVSHDMGMSAKFLQIVNSSFFGLSRHISSPQEATNYLGLEIIRRLILGAAVFSKYGKHFPEMDIIWQHSLKVAEFAKKIAQNENLSTEITELCYVAGLLQDIGMLIFGLLDSNKISRLKNNKADKSTLQLELEIFGATHPEVSAYLTGVWGIPREIVEIIAFHHTPEKINASFQSATGILSIANAIYDHKTNYPFAIGVHLDDAWITSVGISEKIQIWEELLS